MCSTLSPTGSSTARPTSGSSGRAATRTSELDVRLQLADAVIEHIAVDLDEVRAAAGEAGMDVERVVGAGTQFSGVRLRRRLGSWAPRRAPIYPRRVRVLTVGNMYPPHHFGGYELVWRSAVEHLRAAGHEVRVLTTDTLTGAHEEDPPFVHRELRWALREGRFEPLGVRARTAMAKHNHRVLERHLAALRPDVVAWWAMGGLSLTLLESVRRAGLPAVAFVHDDWLDYGRWADRWLWQFRDRRALVSRLVERLYGVPTRVDFDGAARYVFVSERTRRHAADSGLRLTRTEVAHSGIHPDFLDPAPPRDWSWRLLYVGRLDPRKGVDTVVQALKLLPAGAELELVGGWDAREEQRLRALAQRLAVASRIRFAGQLDRDGVASAYDRADVVVFPVRWEEPWGLVPLEAMARGRPVVATGRGGSAEYLGDGQNCLLFDAGDPAGLAAALERLAADPDLRQRLRDGGLRTAPLHVDRELNERVERELVAAVGSPSANRSSEMRILHIGSGLRPVRRGGIVAYTEDLMAEELRRGHDVHYFFSGRYFPLLRRPRLRRWRAGGPAMLEVINSPLYDHGRQPDLELEEPTIERMFRRVLSELRPDVVHFHELAGLPSSLLEVAREAGATTVMTLQDYFPLCSTFKLFDAGGNVCLRRHVGEDCAATVAADPREPWLLFDATLRHQLARTPLMRRLEPLRGDSRLGRLARLASRVATRRPAMSPPASFQRRREVNVERLGGVDRLVAMSSRVAEIYEQLGVDPSRMITIELTLDHFEGIRGRRADVAKPITFATLGGMASTAKGGRLLIDAMRVLQEPAASRELRLLAFGDDDPDLAREARQLHGIELRGPYGQHQLDDLLNEVDVGIMPSVWEEAYGYAGIEFLAKGIPVISNAIGGMVEYTVEGETGWLNRSCSPEELSRIMLDVARHPKQMVDLNSRLLESRPALVKTLARHADEMEASYRQAAADRSGA
jgi:glycogen synthase